MDQQEARNIKNRTSKGNNQKSIGTTLVVVAVNIKKYLQPSACRRPPARARIGRQLNDTIPCSIILVGALEVHIWLGEFVDVYFKVV